MERKTLWVLVGGLLAVVLMGTGVMLGLPMLMLGGWAKIKADQENCSPVGSISQPISSTISTTGQSPANTAASFDSEQLTIARSIVGVVVGRHDIPNANAQQAILITIDAGYTESKLHNLAYGDRDSLGIFQMRPSKGWGTAAQVMNVNYEINKFLDVMQQVPGWQTADIGAVAQAVEHSAYPQRYDGYLIEAQQIYHLTTGAAGTILSASTLACGPDPTQQLIETAIAAAQSKVGSNYIWGNPPDGAAFVSWAYLQAGVKLPPTLNGLVNWPGDSSATLTWIPASQIESGDAPLQPGDIALWSDNQANPSRDNVSRAGLITGSNAPVKIATYNMRGASHTPKTGPESGQARAKTAAQLIMSNGFTAVGLQEMERPQRTQLLASLGSRYQMYPSAPQYAVTKGIWSENSIVWDTTQASLVDAGKLPMPFYFHGAHVSIPLVELRLNATGQLFYVADTHDPAFAPSARYRYLDEVRHAADANQITATGIPLIWAGDWNSSEVVEKASDTYKPSRNRLAVCVMTASGTMRDAYDAAKGRSGTCPAVDAKELPGIENDHIFVSNGVTVTGYHTIDRKYTASDHSVVYITASLGGGTTAQQATTQYVGPNPHKGNQIDTMPVTRQYLAGVLRLNLTTPNGPVTPGGSYVGNDGFTGGSCVVYVEYILERHSARYHGQVDLTTGVGGVAAYTVAQNLHNTLGYRVDHRPAIHATVSFPARFTSQAYGHVAIVAQINPDGSIVVEESNWNTPNGYGTHTVPASEVPYLTYAHTEVGWH